MASAMAAIQAAERGVIVLLNCEESADQMFAQFSALSSPNPPVPPKLARMDLRTYGMGAQILKDVGVGKMRVLAAAQRMPSMTGYGLEITGYVTR